MELYENIIDSVDEGIIVLDKGLRIISFNQTAQRISGVSRERAVGRPISEVLRGNSRVVELAGRTLAAAQTFMEAEATFIDWEGKAVPVSITSSPLMDGRGELLGAIILLRDLTLIKLLEEDLKSRERLAQLGTLAAGMAHELKNPLAGVKALAGLIEREVGEREETRRLKGEVEKMDKLLTDLLDLGRPMRLSLAPVDINRVITEVISAQRPLASEREVTFNMDLDVSLPPVRGDERRLAQVLLNLIKNSLEAVEKGGVVQITSRVITDYHLRRGGLKRGRMIRVDVSDNGLGIPPSHLERIFTPFFSTKEGGTGLGLSICSRIVSEHNGTIKVWSEPGKGTTVSVLLPAYEGEDVS